MRETDPQNPGYDKVPNDTDTTEATPAVDPNETSEARAAREEAAAKTEGSGKHYGKGTSYGDGERSER